MNYSEPFPSFMVSILTLAESIQKLTHIFIIIVVFTYEWFLTHFTNRACLECQHISFLAQLPLSLICFYSQSIPCDLFSHSSFGGLLHDVYFSKQSYWNLLQNYLKLTANDHNCSDIILVFYIIPSYFMWNCFYLISISESFKTSIPADSKYSSYNASDKFRYYIGTSLQRRNYSEIWDVAITSVHKNYLLHSSQHNNDNLLHILTHKMLHRTQKGTISNCLPLSKAAERHM